MIASMPDLSRAVVVNKAAGKRFAVNNDGDMDSLVSEINQRYAGNSMPNEGIFSDIETIAVGINGEWYVLDECGRHEILDAKTYAVELV